MKYEILTDPEHSMGKLHRIRALTSFSDVHEGDIGGWIQSEDNLSQDGDCWVYDDARVYGDAFVRDNSIVKNVAEVHGHALVRMKSVISGTASVHGRAKIINSEIGDSANVYDTATIDNSQISGKAQVFGNAYISWSSVYDNAQVSGNVKVRSKSKIYMNGRVSGYADIFNEDITSKYEEKLKPHDYRNFIKPNF